MKDQEEINEFNFVYILHEVSVKSVSIYMSLHFCPLFCFYHLEN